MAVDLAASSSIHEWSNGYHHHFLSLRNLIMRARASEVASDIIVLNTVIDLFHLIQPAHPDQTVCLSSIVAMEAFVQGQHWEPEFWTSWCMFLRHSLTMGVRIATIKIVETKQTLNKMQILLFSLFA